MASKSDQPATASGLLQRLIEQYVAANPKSASENRRACKVMPAGNTRAVFVYQLFPLVMTSARDCYVTSLDGVEYLDFVSEYLAGMFGHSHPAIKAALEEAAATGFNFGAPCRKEIELAEVITSRFPSIDLVQFCTSGTEANTLAIAVGLNYTKRRKALALVGAAGIKETEFTNQLAVPLLSVFEEWLARTVAEAEHRTYAVNEGGSPLEVRLES
ncbi:pyridoxal phosphate-dependent transferase [Aspergillus tetrazonus]